MFGGKIKPTVSYVVDTLKVAQITRNSLVHGLEQALKGREVYTSTKDSPEVMYYGNVFDDLWDEHNTGKIKLDEKAFNQCYEIAQEVGLYQYIHLIES